MQHLWLWRIKKRGQLKMYPIDWTRKKVHL
jgi:hypothetical protein